MVSRAPYVRSGEQTEDIVRGFGELPELLLTVSDIAAWPSSRGATDRGPVWIVSSDAALSTEPEDALFEDKLRVACTHDGGDPIACLKPALALVEEGDGSAGIHL